MGSKSNSFGHHGVSRERGASLSNCPPGSGVRTPAPLPPSFSPRRQGEAEPRPKLNAGLRALLKYGTYCAVALVCATLAALGSLGAFPLLSVPGHRVCLAGVAAAMLFQAAALFRSKRQDCFIVRREEMIGGSLILFVGAALLLVLLLAGCTPASPHARQITNFYGGESTAFWSLFGADAPFGDAAQDPPERTQKSKSARLPGEAILRAGGAEIATGALLTPRWRVFAGRIHKLP